MNAWGAWPRQVLLDDIFREVPGGTVLLADGTMFKLPAMPREVNKQLVDMAFARFDESSNRPDGAVYSTFYMPIANAHPSSMDAARHRLIDARTVTFGEKIFSHFAGATRN